jgi:FkbM family methyltransferase
MIFYSQQGEDVFIYRNFINKKTTCGIFVELGAMDGLRYSNTKFFQDYLDFTGVLIEPTCQFVDLQKNRPTCDLYNLAVSFKKETIKFLGTDATAGAVESMSNSHRNSWLSNSQEYFVSAFPFCDILSQSNLSYIDLLSIDVEGGELMVLETMDWSIPVYVIVIELDGSNPEKDEKCRNLLQKQGFILYHRMCINEFWYHPNYFRKDFLWDPTVENYIFKNSLDLGKFLYLEQHVIPEIENSLQQYKKPLLISGHSFYLECQWSLCLRYPLSFSPNEIKYCDKVFLNLDCFEPFLENLIKYPPANKFILICHNSDLSFTKIHFENIETYIEHVFSTNCIYSHEKVSPIPLGFVDNKYKCHYKFELVEKNKTNLLYMNFKIQTNPQARQLCFDQFKNQDWIKISSNVTFEKYCQECANSKFVLSPEGTGIDCHRIYEALFLDTIPIIKSGHLDHFYKSLPIVIVDSWEQVNPNWLEIIYPVLWDQLKSWKNNNSHWVDAKFWLNSKNIL